VQAAEIKSNENRAQGEFKYFKKLQGDGVNQLCVFSYLRLSKEEINKA